MTSARPDDECVCVDLRNPNADEKRVSFARVFAEWAGSEDGWRVLFTPDVLIAVSNGQCRGYYFDDGWSIEVWVERGASRMLELLNARLADGDYTVERWDGDGPRAGLLDVALLKGEPFRKVRHLI